MQNALLIFLHLMAAAVAVGSSLFCLFILGPLIQKSESGNIPPEESLELKMLDRLAPTILSCVFTLIISGVYYLLVNYTNQVNLKEGYYSIFGMKMIFVVAALGMSVYLTFGLRTRISDLDLRPENKTLVPEILKSMHTIGQINFWVLCIAIFFGIFLNRC